jgi:hypothetical protein
VQQAPVLSPALRLRQALDALGEAIEAEGLLSRRLTDARTGVEAIEREYMIARKARIDAQRVKEAIEAEAAREERATRGAK